MVAKAKTKQQLSDELAKLRRQVSKLKSRETEYKQREKALRENAEHFRLLVENAKGMIYRYRFVPTPGFEYVSPSVTVLTGYAPEEHYADPFLSFKLAHPDDRQLLESMKEDPSQADKPIILRWIAKDGRVVWTVQAITLVYDDQGNILGFTGIAYDITDYKRVQEALRESEEKCRSIVHNTRVGIASIDLAGGFTFANDALCRMIGHDERELLGKPFADYVYPADLPMVIGLFSKAVTDLRQTVDLEFRVVGPSGRIVYLYASVTRIKNGDETIGFNAILTDITERKASEEMYRTIINTTGDGFYINDTEHRFLDVNDAYCAMLGYSRYEFLNMKVDDVEAVQTSAEIKKHTFNGVKTAHQRFESRHRCKDGRIIDVEISGGHLPSNPEISYVFVRDITERNKTIAELQESEKLLVEIAANYPNSYVSIIENNLTVGFTSGQEFKKQGLDPTQYVGLSLEQIFGEHAPLVKSNYLKTFQGEETQFELFINNQYQLYHAVPLVNGDGKVDRILSVVENITERKLAEERYRTIISTTMDGFWMADNDRNILDVNDAYCALMGYSREELLNMKIEDIETIETSAEIDKRRFETRRTGYQHFESRHRCKDGRLIDVDVSLGYLSFGAGATFVFVRDITRRNMMQRELRQSEVRFRQIFDRAPVGIAIVDSNTGKFLQLNPRCGEIMGRTMKELSKLGFQEVTHPDDLGKDIKNMEQLRSGKKRFFNVEKRYIRPDGSIIWANVTFVPMWAPGETPTSHLTILEDVTMRKRMEDKLRESEELYRSLVEMSPDSVVVDVEGEIAFINMAGARQVGASSPEQMIGRSAAGFFLPSDLAAAHERRREALRGNRLLNPIEQKRVRLDGTVFDVEVMLVPITYHGQPAVQAVVHDITDRKKAEKELSDKTQLLEKVFQSLQDAVFVIDEPSSRIVDCNASALRILGYNRDELIGQVNTIVHVNKAAREEFLQHLEAAVAKKGRMEGFEFRLKRKNGAIFPTKHYVSPLLDEVRKRTGWVSLMRDISKEKRAEKALLKSRQEYRDLSRRLQTMREEERTILAREIHDELGQALTALKMDVSWLSSRLYQEQEALKDKVVSMISLIDNVTQTVKRLSAELRPGLLDDLGLTSAMQWQGMEFTARTGIQCVIASDPETFDIDRDITTAAFRIFQELLNNVARHAKATIVEVNLQEKNGLLKLKIEDNGIGIAGEEITSSKSLGLIGIRERAYYFGGKVKIKGVPGKGTSVAVSIPLRSMKDDTNIGG